MPTNLELEQGIERLSEDLENSRRIADDNVHLFNEEHDRAEAAEARVLELETAMLKVVEAADPLLGQLDDISTSAKGSRSCRHSLRPATPASARVAEMKGG